MPLLIQSKLGHQEGGAGRSKRGKFNPDFFLYMKSTDVIVVVEVKATHALQEGAKRQLLNYVTALNLDLGLLLHFGPRAHHYRVLGKRRPNEQITNPSASG